ncbi:MAG TPA: hypothetical protein ENH55_01395 [Aurantimonas coralicida]|uniref:Uncharacterized protein n=2 Tax=root TaxID=1 RepID=A0A9C9TI05_9HYPH|nr:hypothetical protein [Aurantimonas coralicida]HEU01231.1 hypothetical protein [Aurantimonas coralicida]
MPEKTLIEPRKSERQVRRERADSTAAWRERTRHRPDPRVVDRALLEAIVVVLVDTKIVPPATAMAIVEKATEAAVLGLVRQGYGEKTSRARIGKRLGEHHRTGKTSVVKSALREVGLGPRRAIETPATPPLVQHTA